MSGSTGYCTQCAVDQVNGFRAAGSPIGRLHWTVSGLVSGRSSRQRKSKTRQRVHERVTQLLQTIIILLSKDETKRKTTGQGGRRWWLVVRRDREKRVCRFYGISVLSLARAYLSRRASNSARSVPPLLLMVRPSVRAFNDVCWRPTWLTTTTTTTTRAHGKRAADRPSTLSSSVVLLLLLLLLLLFRSFWHWRARTHTHSRTKVASPRLKRRRAGGLSALFSIRARAKNDRFSTPRRVAYA